MKEQFKGSLFIVCAPSGAGKTSLVKALIKNVQDITLSVSYTTRPKREKEISEENYFFISIDDFKEKIKKNFFIEYAKVFGNYYGTSKQSINNTLINHDVILEIDYQGYLIVKNHYPNAIGIFILPDSIETLKQRLMSRNQDMFEVITNRLNKAQLEISQYKLFDYLVVNKDFNLALEQLKTIILSNRLKKSKQEIKLKITISELLNKQIK